MLGEGIWAPCPTLAASGIDAKKRAGNSHQPARVIVLHITYIRAGVVLRVNMHPFRGCWLDAWT
jgi:hypothetical protein